MADTPNPPQQGDGDAAFQAVLNSLKPDPTPASAPTAIPAQVQDQPKPDATPAEVPQEQPKGESIPLTLPKPEIKHAHLLPPVEKARNNAHAELMRQLIEPPKLTPPKLEPPPAEEHKSLVDQVVKPFGQFGQGVLGGILDVADTGRALLETPFKLGVSRSGEEPSWQDAYEEFMGKENTESSGYQAGKIGGQIFGAVQAGRLAGAGAAMAGAGPAMQAATTLGGGALSGALYGAGNNAREQLKEKNQVDPNEMAPDAAVGAAFSYLSSAVPMAGGMAKKFVGDKLEKSNALKQNLGKVKGSKAAQWFTKLLYKVKHELVEHELQNLEKNFSKFVIKAPPENHFQEEQQAWLKAMNRPSASAQDQLRLMQSPAASRVTTGGASIPPPGEAKAPPSDLLPTKPAKPQAPEPPKASVKPGKSALGVSRRPVYAHGYENIGHAQHIAGVEHTMEPELFEGLQEAAKAIGMAKAAVMHMTNEMEAYARNALRLAQSPGEKSQVREETKKVLNSKGKALADAKRAELTLKQVESEKDKLEKRIADAREYGASRKDIHELDEALQRLHNDPFGMSKLRRGKDVYALANREHMQAPRDLAKDFYGAKAQWIDAMKGLAAAEKQLDKLQAHFIDDMERAETAWQKKTGKELDRLWVKLEIAHPHNPELKTEMAIGLNHKPFVIQLAGDIKREMQDYTKDLLREEEHVVTEVTYHLDTAEGLFKQSGKDAVADLQRRGLLHPIATRTALLAAFGFTTMDLTAQARDGKKNDDNTGLLIGAGIMAAIAGKMYGIPTALRLKQLPAMWMSRYFSNTRALAEMADRHLGVTETSQSLSAQMKMLAGKVIHAVTQAPDDWEYLMQSVYRKPEHSAEARAASTQAIKAIMDAKKEALGKAKSPQERKELTEHLKELDAEVKRLANPPKLSPIGQQLADEIHDEAQAFKAFAVQYQKRYNALYKNSSATQRARMQPMKEAVDFIGNGLQYGKGGLYDDAMFKLMSNAMRAWCTVNPKIWVGGIADVFISGPLVTGPAAIAKAFRDYTTDPVIRGLASKLVLGGQRSEALETSANNKALHMEVIQNRLMSLASLHHYFDGHQRTLQALPTSITSARQFIIHALTNKLPDEINADVWGQLSADLADTIGIDPLSLTKGWIGRSMSGRFVKFVSQPERYANLLAVNISKGNIRWVAASIGAIWQFGGHAAIPTSLRMAGYAFDQTDTAKLVALLDLLSVGQQTFGNQARMLDYDPILYPLGATIVPGLDVITDIVNDLGGTTDKINTGFHAAAQGGSAFLGSKANDDYRKAQQAAYGFMQMLALAMPLMKGFPTRMVGSAAYHVPDVIHGEAWYGVAKETGFTGGTKMNMQEPPKLHTRSSGITGSPVSDILGIPGEAEAGVRGAVNGLLPPAFYRAEEGLRAMAGLPDSAAKALYINTHNVPKSKQDATLRKLSRDSNVKTRE